MPYYNESDYHMGDLVLKFPNPDHPKFNTNDEENTITYKIKDQIFEKLILVLNHE